MKSIIYTFLCVVLIYSCGSNKQSNSSSLSKNISKDQVFIIDIVSSIYHYWYGGQPGISGINVDIEFKEVPSIIFKEAFFQGYKTSINEKSIVDKKLYLHFDTGNGQTMSLGGNEASHSDFKAKIEMPVSLLKNEVALSYMKEDKIYYYIIKNIKEGTSTHMP